MVILTGPRQIGKTWLAQALMKGFQRPQYLNYDSLGDARIIRTQTWALDADLLVLDEVHKMKGWKGFLKGSYDTRPEGQSMLVTGSVRLDAFRQSDESLAGRYFSYRLYPLSVRELRIPLSHARLCGCLTVSADSRSPSCPGPRLRLPASATNILPI
jgi:predicted AAA+ superfamily ATPase